MRIDWVYVFRVEEFVLIIIRFGFFKDWIKCLWFLWCVIVVEIDVLGYLIWFCYMIV